MHHESGAFFNIIFRLKNVKKSSINNDLKNEEMVMQLKMSIKNNCKLIVN